MRVAFKRGSDAVKESGSRRWTTSIEMLKTKQNKRLNTSYTSIINVFRNRPYILIASIQTSVHPQIQNYRRKIGEQTSAIRPQTFIHGEEGNFNLLLLHTMTPFCIFWFTQDFFRTKCNECHPISKFLGCLNFF